MTDVLKVSDLPTRKVESDYYGHYFMSFLGTIDLRKDWDSVEHISTGWSGKYHPATYFRGCYWGIPTEAFLNKNWGVLVFDVWVSSQAANASWKPVPDTPYTKALDGLKDRYKAYRGAGGVKYRAYKAFPACESDKKIIKWVEASKHLFLTEEP